MLFSSISFLYYFLPLVLFVYFLVPRRAKNFVLLLASLVFYFYGEPVYTLLLLASTLSAYLHGLLIDRTRGTRACRAFLWSSVMTSVALLGFFKYSDFFIQNVNTLLSTRIPLLRLALPIGISFYTFQTLSYTIDVYRGDAKVQKSFLRLATYVALFPQLIAGPIVRYTTVEEELSDRHHTTENFALGARRFVFGLAKKVLIADTLGLLVGDFIASDDRSVAFYWVYALAVSLQLYFDFSGYSDMAISLGRIFGFHFLENFNYPFISKSISEFWRRWHMSLGHWFRDYVYIPMGGNRVSRGRWICNVLTVWMLTGFWHGADWTFVLWGLYFALFLVLERLFLQKWLDRCPRVVSHLYVSLVILVSFVLFHANGLSGAASDIACMLGGGGLPLWSGDTAHYLSGYAPVLLLALIGCTPWVKSTATRLMSTKAGGRAQTFLEPLCTTLLVLLVTAYFVDGSFSAFLYFRF
ncbi:MAG: MBOAT family protein [Ruminococcaceae bacterium]|nr:MBOAT family protein [Oscillospiraceae bacterium]